MSKPDNELPINVNDCSTLCRVFINQVIKQIAKYFKSTQSKSTNNQIETAG